MPSQDKHLYVIVHPVNALVASQLPPEKFAEHYTIGSSKHYEGKVIFGELDPSFRDKYFEIDHYLKETVPHPDGSPKKTKFISSYAVLEHIDLKALKSLYLVTTDGKSLRLKPKPYTAVNEPGMVRVYQEICPLSNLVASTLDQRAFAKYITMETRSKGAPKILFTQYEFDVETFLYKNQNRDMMTCPIPDTYPNRMHDYLLELKENSEKKTKTVSLNSTLTAASWRLIRHGFWFAGADELAFFPMPSVKELEKDHYEWWRSAY
ncbi:MAG: hypothetical protein COV48_13795 [Elusimicrobia bacterium CG11_big_fil_rev_8_21_14_0_20_64_6]|nr:MAG: hypothetical protein COV48_13795 [Elusimicrobia bacterium CG11_big_fil_rev_8_21_14_0_20_64_6]